MPPVTAAETKTTLLETVRALPTEGQRAVLSYAMFLHHQEQERLAESTEAEWARHFGQPGKLTKFAEWAQQSLAQSPPEPWDDSKL